MMVSLRFIRCRTGTYPSEHQKDLRLSSKDKSWQAASQHQFPDSRVMSTYLNKQMDMMDMFAWFGLGSKSNHIQLYLSWQDQLAGALGNTSITVGLHIDSGFPCVFRWQAWCPQLIFFWELDAAISNWVCSSFQTFPVFEFLAVKLRSRALRSSQAGEINKPILLAELCESQVIDIDRTTWFLVVHGCAFAHPICCGL